jgi:N-acetylglucosamine kinase-like BadF-type ATPase
VVVAGTGNNVRGRDRQGREGRITGNGGRFGEYGGASELVGRAVKRMSHEWTRRGAPTALTPAFLKRTGAKDLFNLIEGLEMGWYQIGADAAPLVVQTAYDGDPVAREIVEWAGRELGLSAAAVIRQLGLEAEAFDVVQVGSLHAAGPLFCEPLLQAIQETAPNARLVRLEAPPVAGAVLLGMAKAGLDGYAVRERLIETTRLLLPD